ncbi:hypothetical protein ACU6QH_01615 [Aeromonas veronii]|uniref:hypothetical protein n=1 Tax=Aeromonas TaxID=642 RepID=UPI001118DE53|nr:MULTISPECIES: hypothetical protein [Aeromonas]TNI79551.1 hypothetical protein CF119_19765 [Aeromonas sobria]
MANMRLNANLRTVSFSKTVSVLEELELSSGKCVRRYRAVNVHLGTVDVDSDFSLIKELTEADAKNAKLWVQEQQRLVQYAYMDNQKKGLIGGCPVIKRNKSDDDKYRDHYGYIPDCRVGEFIGVIINQIPLSSPIQSVESNNSLYENIIELRKKGRLSDVFKDIFNALIKIHKINPFTKNEWFSLFLGEKDCFYLITAASGYKQSIFEKMLPLNHRATILSQINKALKNRVTSKTC